MRKLSGIAEEIMRIIVDLGQLIPEPFETPNEMVRRLRRYDRGRIQKTVTNLKQSGWIAETRPKSRTYILTDLGKARALRAGYLLKPKKIKKNGLATIIIFDIPEELKRSRDFLRRFLLQNGFTMLQESVFIGPWTLYDHYFKELLNEIKVSDYVSVIEGKVLHS